MLPCRKAAYLVATFRVFNIDRIYPDVKKLTAKPVDATKVDVMGDLEWP